METGIASNSSTASRVWRSSSQTSRSTSCTGCCGGSGSTASRSGGKRGRSDAKSESILATTPAVARSSACQGSGCATEPPALPCWVSLLSSFSSSGPRPSSPPLAEGQRIRAPLTTWASLTSKDNTCSPGAWPRQSSNAWPRSGTSPSETTQCAASSTEGCATGARHSSTSMHAQYSPQSQDTTRAEAAPAAEEPPPSSEPGVPRPASGLRLSTAASTPSEHPRSTSSRRRDLH
mmetsp:Transcript_6189/g.18069  ORF Transcript_6189/g.18069 Transcript_6189/m.18069 type:complete len:234 (-) Transcript_6189:31-732(-)